MLLKNGVPCKDEYQWRCDGCGCQTQKSVMPETSVYPSGRACIHLVDAQAGTMRDLCHECAVKETSESIDGALKSLSGIMSGIRGDKNSPPEWVKDILKEDE